MATQESTNQYERRKARTKRRLREAIERLRAGRPVNSAVRTRKWKIDVRTVAQEAGVSRNAIYQNHPEIVEELRAARSHRAGDQAANSEAGRLKRKLQEAQREQRLLLTENAGLLARAKHAEEELQALKAHEPALEIS